jgi:N-acetylmuramoyl-L-alanine amidase
MPEPDQQRDAADRDRRKLIRDAASFVSGSLVLSLAPWQIARGATLLGVRVWPAPDYSRVTLEHDAPLSFTHFLVNDATKRLVVDIEGIDLTPQLKELVGKVEADDPYIALVRIGQNRPRVVRLVIELKEAIEPQVFSLEPVGPYQHRIVLDLHPVAQRDPLMALLNGPHADPPQTRAETAQDEAALAREIEKATAEPVAPPPRQAAKPVTAAPISRFITIAIDPGHGGEDPGAVGKRGTLEKNVTLAIARRLAALVGAEPNMRVMLTRDGDFFVPLAARVAKARRVQADLFVSIHADAWIKPDARGSSVFALSERGATSSAAAWMARRENDADLIGGVNIGTHDAQLARVLLDLSTTAQINDSLQFGAAVLRELERVNRLHKPRVEQAGFAVLKAPDIPSILVETAFISNPEEEKRLKDDDYQQGMAVAVFNGIKRYFAKHPTAPRTPLG